MKQKENPIITFFASVSLALFVLFILAITSIIGTVIPQNETPDKYLQYYGEKWSTVFHALNITDMYHSWWFLSLLTLLSVNLIVCTLKRLPHVWQTVMQDNLKTTAERLHKMSPSRVFVFNGPAAEAAAAARVLLSRTSTRIKEKSTATATMLFIQKGAWTRFGVYAVHASILLIFIGAIIGTLYGFKAFVMLPAGSTTSHVYEMGSNRLIPLGFDLRCDQFTLTLYDTGAPKEFRSELTVLNDKSELLKKSIVVNDPLSFQGLTFYQSSYEAKQGQLFAQIKNTKTGAATGLPVKPRTEVSWPDAGVRFGVINFEETKNGAASGYRFKIWFTDGTGTPSEFWMDFGATAKIERPATTYDFTLTQHYATGLQVAKDPGVWWVYVGCGLMLAGIMVAFFLSHRRIWILVTAEGDRTEVLVCGGANKNKLGFENQFNALLARFANHAQFTPQG